MKKTPRYENFDWYGSVGVRAVCEPDGYCRDGHICGKLDLGIVRADNSGQNDLDGFADQWAESQIEGGGSGV